MNQSEFIKLVKSMRTSQKEYFKSKSFASLEKSKSLEREVDSVIKELESPKLGL